MNRTVIVENADKYYEGLLELLRTRGKHVTTRGKNMIEVTGVTGVVTNPLDRILTEKSRNWPLKGFTSEFLWYMSGNRNTGTIAKYLKAWPQFADENGDVNSNYGVYMWRGIPRCIEILREDPGARHACFNIYDTKHSADKQSRDVPCTFAVQFFIREKKLDVVVMNRSRDCIFGETGGDFFNFSLMQELVANELEVDVGTYTSMISSLHIYEKDWSRMFQPMKFDNRYNGMFKERQQKSVKFTTFWEDMGGLMKIAADLDNNRYSNALQNPFVQLLSKAFNSGKEAFTSEQFAPAKQAFDEFKSDWENIGRLLIAG